jgi:hypothetical protein
MPRYWATIEITRSPFAEVILPYKVNIPPLPSLTSHMRSAVFNSEQFRKALRVHAVLTLSCG